MTALETLLSRLVELEKKATKRPWTQDYDPDGCLIDHEGQQICVTADREFFSAFNSGQNCKYNADFIAAARNALPVLLEILKVQGEALEFYATQWRSDVYVGPTDALLRDEGSAARGALTTAEKLAQGLESGK